MSAIGLIPCPACGANVSSQAPACPKCAHPMLSERAIRVEKPSWVVPLKILGALAMLVGFVMGGVGAISSGGGSSIVLGGALFVGGMIVFVIGRFGE